MAPNLVKVRRSFFENVIFHFKAIYQGPLSYVYPASKAVEQKLAKPSLP